MKLTVNYQLTHQGQKASLLSGGSGTKNQTVTGEIAPEEISHPLIVVLADGSLGDVNLNKIPVNHEIRRSYGATWQMDPVYQAAFEAPLSFDEAWRLAQEYHATGERAWVSLNPKLKQAQEEAQARDAEERRQIAERQRRDREAQERREQEDREAENRLQSWAISHGSKLLRARIEENFDWHALARREYTDQTLEAAGLPHGYLWQDGCAERTKPTLGEIDLQRQYRAALGEKATVGLAWLAEAVDYDYDHDYEPKPWGKAQAALDVEITTPDGKTVNRVIPLADLT
jgi:hypothetical protein